MTDVPQPFAVSVVVPAYQSAAWIGAALAAIKAQTLRPREVIVVDDGSTDRTSEIAEAAGAVVLRRENGGPSAARNAGIAHATSPWVAFCDADDVWEPRMLARHANALARCPQAVLSFTDGDEFDDGGTLAERVTCSDRAYRAVRKTTLADGVVLLDAATLASSMYRSPFILTPSAVVSRAALDAVGGFDEGLRVAEDYDLFLRLVASGPVVAIEEQLVHVRKHASNITRDETVNTEWHRQFWKRIEDAPGRYPPGTRRFLRDDRLRRLSRAGEYAVRVGRFADARAYLAEALQLRAGPRDIALYATALLWDNPAGRRLHGDLRRRWRAGAWRYAKPAQPRSATAPAQTKGPRQTDEQPVSVSGAHRYDG